MNNWITLAVLIAFGLSTSFAASKPRPNIVVYMIDDLGWNQISAGQGTMHTHTGVFQTPHLELLANNGLSFTQAYMQPNCAPSRATLHKIELGDPNVAMGSYFQVLRVLGLESDFGLLALDDQMGRKLQDLDLVTKKRAPRRKVENG